MYAYHWCYLCSVLFSIPSQGCKALSRQNSHSPPTCPTSPVGFTAESSPLAQKLRGTALKHPLAGCTTFPLGCVVHPKWCRWLFDTLPSVTCGLFHPYTHTDDQHGTHITKLVTQWQRRHHCCVWAPGTEQLQESLLCRWRFQLKPEASAQSSLPWMLQPCGLCTWQLPAL